MGFTQQSEIARDEFVRRVTRQMCAGSDAAYREFYEAYFDRLYHHLLAATRGEEDLSRELLQAVLLRVVRYIEPFEEERRLWGWLRHLARSAHIDHLRRLSCRPEASALELLDDLSPAPPPEDAQLELMQALDASLGELEPGELQVLQRVYFDKLPQEQIAALDGTTRKAVESRLARIRLKLRKLILEKLKDYALLF